MSNRETAEKMLAELSALEAVGIKVDSELGHGRLIKEIADFVKDQPENIEKNKEMFFSALNNMMTFTRIETVFTNVGITFDPTLGIGKASIELKNALSAILIAYLGLKKAEDGMWYTEDKNPDFAADEYVVTDLCCNPEAYDVNPEEIWGCFGEQNEEMKDEIIWKTGYEIGA